MRLETPFAVLLLSTLFLSTVSLTAQSQAINMTLIGTGEPVPRIDHFGPSTLVEAAANASFLM